MMRTHNILPPTRYTCGRPDRDSHPGPVCCLAGEKMEAKKRRREEAKKKNLGETWCLGALVAKLKEVR